MHAREKAPKAMLTHAGKTTSTTVVVVLDDVPRKVDGSGQPVVQDAVGHLGPQTSHTLD